MKEGDNFIEHFKVTDEVYEGFIHIFKDKNFMHVDDEQAKAKGFKSKVMHGNILNGFLSYFIGECLPVKNVIIHKQSIQYKNPMYLHDLLQFEAVVKGVYESVQAVVFKFNFKNEQQETLAKGEIQIGILS